MKEKCSSREYELREIQEFIDLHGVLVCSSEKKESKKIGKIGSIRGGPVCQGLPHSIINGNCRRSGWSSFR